MGQAIAEKRHHPVIGIGAKNSQAAQIASAFLFNVPHENSISREEETLPRPRRHEERPQPPRPHHGHREKSPVFIGIENQTRREERRKHFAGEGICQHQRKLEMSLDRNRMPFEPVKHGSLQDLNRL